MRSDYLEEITLIITTHNRKKELLKTLEELNGVISYDQILICDDASNDGTYSELSKSFPKIQWIVNATNLGLIASRNRLMKSISTKYVISLDDDAHFLNPEVINESLDFMEIHKDCAILAFRLFWGLDLPKSLTSSEKKKRVRNFVGAGNLIRLEAWKKSIKYYPEWYIFYGEEDFASLKLFQNNWKIIYYPDVLIHHRVSVLNRKLSKDHLVRTRRALHAAWSNYLIFYPCKSALLSIAYSFKEQLRLKFFKGEFKILKPLLFALFDLSRFINKRNRLNCRLTKAQLKSYLRLPAAPIYWKPEDEKKIKENTWQSDI